MLKRIGALVGALLIGVLSAALAMALTVSTPVQARPADEATTPQLVVFANGTRSYTQTFTSTSVYIGDRTLMQLFVGLDVSGTQTVTMKIQTSPDGVRLWSDYVTISAGSVDTTVLPSQHNAIGVYARAIVQAGTTGAFTPELKMVKK